MVSDHLEVAKKVLHLISEYGRWDDLVELVYGLASHEVTDIIKKQLWEDVKSMELGKSVSLLAKWLPSENTSSKDSVEKAELIRKRLGLGSKRYRKTLTALRKHIGIVEQKMSSKQWTEIDYQKVPSRANLVYNKAFLRNDEERRRDFLGKLEKGEVRINAGTLFPHDIVHKYVGTDRSGSYYGGRGRSIGALDATLEGLWKALPDLVKGDASTLVVCDSSGSMESTIANTEVTALEVSNSLAIYFAERCSGAFKDKFVTFSGRPSYVDLSGCTTLKSKLQVAYSHSEVENTNVEAVFEMVLKTAVDNKMHQEDLPRNILLISDMEFDASTQRTSDRLFETIEKRYASKGYLIPRVVFWNVNGRTKTIPMTMNKLGVALVSGFSPNITKMVMSGKLDPYDCLIETLESERYLPVRAALLGVNS